MGLRCFAPHIRKLPRQKLRRPTAPSTQYGTPRLVSFAQPLRQYARHFPRGGKMLLQLIIYAIHKYFRIPVPISPRAAAGRVGTIINPKKAIPRNKKRLFASGKFFYLVEFFYFCFCKTEFFPLCSVAVREGRGGFAPPKNSARFRLYKSVARSSSPDFAER